MVVIREMGPLDIEMVREIAVQTWRDTYSKFIPENIQDKVLLEAYSAEAMEKRFKNSLNLLAENDERITGYAFFLAICQKKMCS